MIQQTKSSKRMQEIQPELKALKEKYKSKDAVTQQKYREEMQKMMSERKINPAAGCLTSLNSDADFIWFLSCNQPDECHL